MKWLSSLVLIFGLSACVSARMSDRTTDRLFQSGQYDQAAARLEKGWKEQGADSKDALLYLLDLGLTYHSSGRFEESNQAFLKADKIAEIKDYTSLSTEAGTFLTSDNIKDYKGEDFEKVLINTYLAMNYALMGDYENALVELRRVNHKLEMMITQGQRKYQQSAFARYLSGILFESDKNYNDAYISYKKTAELMPEFPGLGQDLWRCAKALSMPDEMEVWDEKYKLTPEDHQRALEVGHRSKKSEIIVLYENGISPEKTPNPQFNSLPIFRARFNPVRAAHVEAVRLGQGAVVSEGSVELVGGQTLLLEDIETTAIRNLQEKYGSLIAKKLAGVVVKESVAYAIQKQTDSPLLGFLAKVVMYSADQADLRSWHLLPRDLQILRIPVQPGTYQVKLTPLGSSALPLKTVQVAPGKKVFVNFRFMP